MTPKNGSQNLLIKVGGQICLILMAALFAFFGIEILRFAFSLNDPFSFILTFFSSNLIILISLALLTGFVFKLIALIKGMRQDDSHTD